MSSINNALSGNYLEAFLTNALQNADGTANQTNSAAASSNGTQSDSGQLSPFARLLSTLQQLQQSNPTQYAQVTQQIATNLQSAAQTATADGNTTAASQLNTLATDFTNASTSGQLPNIQDLAQAVGGGGHHHHHHHHSSDSDSSSADTSNNTDTPLSQLLAAFQTGGSQNGSLNPAAIIFNTLSSAGITTSSS